MPRTGYKNPHKKRSRIAKEFALIALDTATTTRRRARKIEDPPSAGPDSQTNGASLTDDFPAITELVPAGANTEEPDVSDLPDLIGRLQTQRDGADRTIAIERIESLGRGALSTLRELGESLDNDQENVRLAALGAIGSMGRDAEGAIEKVRERLKSGNSEFGRVLAASALVN